MAVSWREKCDVEAPSMFEPPPGGIAHTPVPAVCGHLGPYFTERQVWDKKAQEWVPRQRIIACNRPAHDSRENHQHGTAKRGPEHEWTPAGRKVRPADA